MGKGIYTRTPEMGTGKYLRTEKHLGANHHNYKGDNVSYSGLHYWVSSRLGKPSKCEKCGTTDSPRYEWANRSGKYLRELNDWERLCKKCHNNKDKTTDKGWLTRKEKYGTLGRKNELSRNAKGQYANMGTKIDLALIQGAGFIGDTVDLPPKKPTGRPRKEV